MNGIGVTCLPELSKLDVAPRRSAPDSICVTLVSSARRCGRMGHCWTALLALVSGFAWSMAVGQSAATRHDTGRKSRQETIFWQTRESHPIELGRQFAELYAALTSLREHRIEIPTRVVSPVGNTRPEEVMRQNGLYYGQYFPYDVDAFLCGLNPRKCKVLFKPRWTLASEDSLIVPAIIFEQVRQVRATRKAEHASLESIVVDNLHGCDQFDASCKQTLLNLNPDKRSLLSPTFEGWIQVPARAFRTTIPIAIPVWMTRPALHDALAELPRNALLLPTKQADPGSTSWHAESVTAQIAESSRGDRQTILRLISHPFARNAPLGSQYSVTVAIVDVWMYPRHCLFDSGRLHILNAQAPDTMLLSPLATKCGELAQADIDRDHATHLVGLIASRRNAPSGPGINPSAFVDTVQISPDSFNDASYVSKVIEKLNEILQEKGGPRIFNLSFSYPFTVDPHQPAAASDLIEDFIRHSGRNRLFVVAASEKLLQRVQRPRSCTARPVCLDAPNVITVAATDLTPQPGCPHLLPDSNHGPGIDIAAPGLNIVSAIAGNRTGLLSGSSQAAPLVTGALSLLLAKNDQISPLVAKNRLLYTADLCDGIDVFSGRLNIDRALAYEHGQFVVDRKEPFSGAIMNSQVLLHVVDVMSHRAFVVQWAAVKRIQRRKNGFYDLYYHEEAPDDDAGALSHRVVAVDDPPQRVRVNFGDNLNGRDFAFDLPQLADYVAPIRNLDN